MSKRVEEAALKAYPKEIRDKNGVVIDIGHPQWIRDYYIHGYEQAEKDIISIIESRLSELLGDAQPTPILRYELQDLIKKIKEENNG